MTLDIVINIGRYKGSFTETLIRHQLNVIALSKGYKPNSMSVIYVIAVKEGKVTKRHRALVDHIDKIANSLNIHVKVIFNTNDKGLAHGRNIGLLHSKADIIAYLDDDAIPSKNWVSRLHALFKEDENLAGVFGSVMPLFIDDRGICNKIPKELYWLFSCTSSYMPTKLEEFYRGFGANMAFRREIVYKIGGFRMSLGVGTSKRKWIGGEETDLALRLCNKGYKVIYDPKLVVYHIVPQSRCTLNYALKRAYEVGKTNAIITHTYKKYIKKECKEQLTPEMLRKILSILFRTSFSNMFKFKNIDQIAFQGISSIAFILGMIIKERSK